MEASTWTEITINGKTYHGVDEMPPDVRTQFEQMQSMLVDKNNNGIPDIVENGANGANGFSQVTTRTFRADRSDLRVPRGSPSPRSLGSGTNRESNGDVTMSRSSLVLLLAGMALVAAGVTWILSR